MRLFAEQALDALDGRLDILVNNAGIFQAGPTKSLSDATVDALLATNIRVPHQLVAAYAPLMAEAGSGIALYPVTKQLSCTAPHSTSTAES